MRKDAGSHRRMNKSKKRGKKGGATAAVSLGCAALSYPEVQEKPVNEGVFCNTSGLLIRIYFPLQVTQSAFLGWAYSLLETRHIPLPLPFSSMPSLQCV